MRLRNVVSTMAFTISIWPMAVNSSHVLLNSMTMPAMQALPSSAVPALFQASRLLCWTLMPASLLKFVHIRFGISPGQQAERGLATTKGILSYTGKPLKPFAGHERAFGWQDLYRQDYPELGRRWMANCDIPDLDLLPERYGIQSIKFSAGLELSAIHLGLWGLSWLMRCGLPLRLSQWATPLLKAADWFNRFGSADGGMHMIIEGIGPKGQRHERRWFIIAKDGYGPHIPTIPAILLAQNLANGRLRFRGASPCLGLVSLDEYRTALAHYPIETFTGIKGEPLFRKWVRFKGALEPNSSDPEPTHAIHH